VVEAYRSQGLSPDGFVLVTYGINK